MNAVCSAIVVCGGGDAVCSGIVVYDGGDIVFGAKRSNQWMQYTVDAVESRYMVDGTLSLIQIGQTSGPSTQWMQWNSSIWWWRHCLWCKKVKPVDSVDAVTQWIHYTVDAVHSGIVLYGGRDIVFDTKSSNQWTQGMQYAVDAVE